MSGASAGTSDRARTSRTAAATSASTCKSVGSPGCAAEATARRGLRDAWLAGRGAAGDADTVPAVTVGTSSGSRLLKSAKKPGRGCAAPLCTWASRWLAKKVGHENGTAATVPQVVA
eukprot:362378-Chlamydomonas_euryale.AAC.3